MKIVKLLSVLPLVICSGLCRADVESVTVQPQSATIDADRDNTLPLVWNIAFDGSANLEVATSKSGSFLRPQTGEELGSVAVTLSASGSSSTSAAEAVPVPASLTRQLYLAGVTQIFYERSFAGDSGAPVSAALPITLTASPAIKSVAAQPARIGLPGLADTPLNFTWQLDLGLVAHWVTSSEAVITDSLGNPLTSLDHPLEGSGRQLLTLADSAVLPGELLRQWVSAGISQLRYRRTFRDDFGNQRAAFAIIDLPAGGLLGVTGLPALSPVDVRAGAELLFNWQVMVRPGQTKVQSSSGSLRAATGELLLEVDRQLDGGGNGNFSIPEKMSLGAGVANNWMRAGHNRLVYTRRFTDTKGASRSASVTINLANHSGALSDVRSGLQRNLEIAALRLTFPGGENFARIAPGASLRARVQIAYGGSGLIRGLWQLADPVAGRAHLFRTLSVVSEYLPSGQEFELQSPALPSTMTGNYQLRFCLLDWSEGEGTCTDGGQLTQVNYFVAGSDPPQQRITGLRPDRQVVGKKISFAWEPVAGAAFYRLEILGEAEGKFDLPQLGGSTEDRPPEMVSGRVIGAGSAGSEITAQMRGALRAGREYRWRIVALDTAGKPLAQSDAASFRYDP